MLDVDVFYFFELSNRFSISCSDQVVKSARMKTSHVRRMCIATPFTSLLSSTLRPNFSVQCTPLRAGWTTQRVIPCNISRLSKALFRSKSSYLEHSGDLYSHGPHFHMSRAAIQGITLCTFLKPNISSCVSHVNTSVSSLAHFFTSIKPQNSFDSQAICCNTPQLVQHSQASLSHTYQKNSWISSPLSHACGTTPKISRDSCNRRNMHACTNLHFRMTDDADDDQSAKKDKRCVLFLGPVGSGKSNVCP